jgi:inorganic pyrophosphatase
VAVRCIVETPRDTRSPGVPPVHLGFVPGTLTMRREPVGALIISDDQLLPGSEVDVEPIGVLRTGGGCDRLVCGRSGSHLNEDLLGRIEDLYSDEGSADWLGAEAAAGLVAAGRARFASATLGPE